MAQFLKWVAVGAVVALAVWKVVDLTAPEPGVGHWRSAADRERYADAYREVLTSLPPADESRDVATSFGTVRVLTWEADTTGAPVLLLPGRSSGAPMWAENLPSWIGERTVHAIDPIGDAGFSTQNVPLTGPQDQAAWMAETITGLGVDTVHVVGHSFGGAGAAELAVEHPELLASLTLLEPVMVIEPLPASTYFWATVTLLPTPQSWQDRALAEIGGTTVAEVQQRTPLAEMIDAGAGGFASALPLPRTLGDEQWRSLSMPVSLDIGDASELAGGEKAAARIRALLPEATVTVWKGGTHSLPMDEHERIGEELLKFWAQAD